MKTLKEIKRYPDTNSVEATWVDRVETPAPFIEGHDVYVPPTITEVVVKCHSYDQVQMNMLAVDLGADLADNQHIIDEVLANLIVRSSDLSIASRISEIKAELSSIDQRRIRPIAEGDTDYLATLNAQATALRAELQDLLK